MYNKGDNSINNIGGRITPEEAAEINKKGEQTAEFDREQLIAYREQLSAYSDLFYDTFDYDADAVFIAPVFLERYDELGKKNGYKLGRIDRAEVLKPFRLDIDEEETPQIDWTEVDNAAQSMRSMLENTQKALLKHESDLRVINGLLKLDYDDIVYSVNNIEAAINAEKSGAGITPVESILSKIQATIKKIEEFNKKAKEVYKPVQQPAPPVQPATRDKKFMPSRREATGHLREFNNIDNDHLGLSNAQKISFARVSALPDFIESSEWELNINSYLSNMGTLINSERSIKSPNVVVTIRYDEHLQDGNVVHHVFPNLLLQVAQADNSGNKYNHIRLENPLLIKIDSILFDKKEDGTFV